MDNEQSEFLRLKIQSRHLIVVTAGKKNVTHI